MCILNSKCAFQKANVCLNRTELATKRTPGVHFKKKALVAVRVFLLLFVRACVSIPLEPRSHNADQ